MNETAVEVEKTAPRAVPDGLAEQFARRSRPVEGGHREWTGSSRTASGGGRFRHRGKDYTAAQAAFILRTGRAPVGLVRPACEHPHCCEPAHVDDRATRQHEREALADITGMEHRPWACEHDKAVHTRRRANGKRYCAECNRQASRPHCSHGNPVCADDEGVRPYVCGPRCETHQPARTRPYHRPTP